MNKKLYNMMDWADVEEIVYAESTHPDRILGSHNVGKNSLIQAFFPGANAVSLLTTEEKFTTGKKVPAVVKMEEMDEAGFFAAILPGKNRNDYKYKVEFDDKTIETPELYGSNHAITEAQAEELNGGSCYGAYKILGAHVKTIDKVLGTAFAVWAPNALRVSVIGDFNDWNGMCHQMLRLGDTGIFELFVPGVKAGNQYKYELLIKGNEKVVKPDPYALEYDEESGNCVVPDEKDYKWTDKDYIVDRTNLNVTVAPLNIYEVHLGSFADGNIKDIAKKVIERVSDMGYTHVEIMPITEYADDNSNGYSTTSYYAPTNRYGKPEDYKSFVNELHKAGIGVIMQWNVNSFSQDKDFLAVYDGTCLFEHEDGRKGIDARNGQLIFNYLRPEVKEYLIGNALYWIGEYHIDAIKFNDVTSMLYLDYYRNPGEWVCNIYGGNENLEAIEFIKKANKHIHKNYKGVFTIADEKSGFYSVTKMDNMGASELADSLGFDFTLNGGFNSDILEYVANDPINRSSLHGELTGTMLYQYRENYIIPVSHSDVDFGKGGIINKMFGDEDVKYANLRAFYGYMMMHPGKKQIFMGQEYANPNSFEGNEMLDMSIEKKHKNKNFKYYMRSLNLFYLNHEQLYANDSDVDGFEWINNMSANENVISFMRKGKTFEDFLYVVINFANCVYEKYKLGVPFKGKYKEVFNSDELSYGGQGNSNARVIPSKKDECDGREESIKVTLAPLAVSVFEYTPYTKAELDEIKKREEEKERKRILKEKQKEEVAKKKALMREKLAKEKAKIRASIKEELERKIKEAEEKIASGSETVADTKTKTKTKKK